MDEIYTGNKCTAAGMLNRNEHANLSKALHATDLERRTAAARSLLKEHP
jgi:hypothetical protein